MTVVSGIVIKGMGLGKKLGFPTMNIHPKKLKTPMLFGVYAVWVKTPIGVFPGALHYGPRKTQDLPLALEVHCIGLTKKLYGKKITISFVKRIRGTKKFKTILLLKKAIKSDIQKVGKILSVS